MATKKDLIDKEKFIEDKKQQSYERQLKMLDKLGLEYKERKPQYKHNAKTYKPASLIKAEEVFEYTEIEDIEEHNREIQENFDRALGLENDTTYTKHGMLTHDNRYKGETGDIVNKIRNAHHLSNDQAYYFYYFAISNGLTYEETKEQLLSSKDFEDYDKLKKARREMI